MLNAKACFVKLFKGFEAKIEEQNRRIEEQDGKIREQSDKIKNLEIENAELKEKLGLN